MSSSVRRLSWTVSIPVAYVLFVLCWRLWASAYTSGDDGYTTLAALNPAGMWASAQEMARFQGRFYQLFVYPLAMWPFVHGDLTEIAVWKIFTFLFMAAGVGSLFLAAFNRAMAVIACVLMLLLFDTVGGSYNPFHGLPLWFGIGCGALAASLACHIWSLKRSSTWISLFAAVFYLLALLTYEIALLYTPLFLMLSWFYDRGGRKWPNSTAIFRIIRSVSGIALISATYLVAYVAYRRVYPGTYTGAGELGVSALGRTLKPIVEFSINGLYWTSHYSGPKALTVQAVTVVLALASAAVIAWRGLPQQADSDSDAPPIPPGFPAFLMFGTIILYVFVPNVLFGLTERYRIWAGDGVQFYLGSVHSAVAIVFLMCFALILVRQHLGVTKGGLVATIALVPLLVFGYANHRNSQNFFSQSELMSSRWAIADWAATELNVEASSGRIPATDIMICGQGFTENRELPVYFRNADMLADVDLFWSRYFSWKMKRGVTYKSPSVVGPSTQCHAYIGLDYRKRTATLKSTGRTNSARIPNNRSLAW